MTSFVNRHATDAQSIAADRLITRRVQQSRRMSLIETCVSIAIGFVVSMVIQAVVLPAFGHDITLAQNFWITCIFTVASILRGYLVRRYFVLLAHAS
jgi:high-affinity nickel permease